LLIASTAPSATSPRLLRREKHETPNVRSLLIGGRCRSARIEAMRRHSVDQTRDSNHRHVERKGGREWA
jgi:hypothetical protein